jgi:predicted enzyme related to lactoylglutathione lyase
VLDSSREVEFSFTKLVVRDLERATSFYASVCAYAVGNTYEASLDSRPVRETILMNPKGAPELVLFAYVEGPHPPPGSVITVFDTVDLDAFQARVLEAGGTVVEPIGTLSVEPLMRFAVFADPEGVLLEALER